jgi:hypothetical protein
VFCVCFLSRYTVYLLEFLRGGGVSIRSLFCVLCVSCLDMNVAR